MRYLAIIVALCGIARAERRAESIDTTNLAMGPLEAEPPFVDVLTFGVGARIFEKFGHAAICLRYHDPRNPTVCFNYGVTDFGESQTHPARMTWHFLRGEQRFWVEPSLLGTMVGFYKFEDRDIWQQTLPLAPEAARALEAKLWSSLAESNRYYYYDHFFNNCTTRLRDMIDDATGGKLAAAGATPYPLTFREMGRRGLAEFPPLLAVTDFVMGRQLDDTPTLWQAMFHPEVLRQQIAARLGVAPVLINKRLGPDFPTDGPTDRLQMLGLALIFALPLLVAKLVKKLETLALAWATLELTAWGVIIWGLVIVSAIPGVRWNEAIFVFVPFDAVLPFLRAERRRRYALIRVAMLAIVSLLGAIGLFHQSLGIPIVTAFAPLALVAFVRARSSP